MLKLSDVPPGMQPKTWQFNGSGSARCIFHAPIAPDHTFALQKTDVMIKHFTLSGLLLVCLEEALSSHFCHESLGRVRTMGYMGAVIRAVSGEVMESTP